MQLLRDSAHCYWLQGQYDEAYHCYQDSLELAEQIGQEIGILEAITFRARTAIVRGDLQKAKQDVLELLPEYHKKGLRRQLRGKASQLI